MSAVFAVDDDLSGTDAAFVEGKDRVHELADAGSGGTRGAPVEAQGLGGNVADTREFELCLVEIGADIGRGALLCKVEEVDDRFQRVVDLVRDGAGEAADKGELLVFAQTGFSALARGDVGGGAEPLRDVPGGVQQRDGTGEGPANGSVGKDDSVLEFNGAFSSRGDLQSVEDAGAVLGMDVALELVAVG